MNSCTFLVLFAFVRAVQTTVLAGLSGVSKLLSVEATLTEIRGKSGITVRMNTLIVLVVLVSGSVQGAEWMTSGSNHCIERCHPGTRKELNAVLWCKVVDGVHKEHQPAGAESGRPSAHEDENLTEEDMYAWDYCTPAAVDALEGGEIFEEGVEAVVVPERVDRTKRQTGKFLKPNYPPN